jgi:hypothetical protein
MTVYTKEAKMNFRKFQLGVLATALGGAVGIASAQQAGMSAGDSGSVGTTPAAAKAAIDVRGNAALTSETAVTGTPIQGSPGTQSGAAVTDTASMGASGAWGASASSQSFEGLSGTQLRSLQRHNALR